MIRAVVAVLVVAIALSGCATIRESPIGQSATEYFTPRSETGEDLGEYWLSRVAIGVIVLGLVCITVGVCRASDHPVENSTTTPIPGEPPRCQPWENPTSGLCTP